MASWAFWAHNAKRASNAPRAHNALVGKHPNPFERLTAAALSAFADAHENDFQKHKQGNTCFNQRKRATAPHKIKHHTAQKRHTVTDQSADADSVFRFFFLFSASLAAFFACILSAA